VMCARAVERFGETRNEAPKTHKLGHSKTSNPSAKLRFPHNAADAKVPKPTPKHISVAAASAANASGSLQTALSKVTRRSAASYARSVSRPVTSDRVLTFANHYRLRGVGPEAECESTSAFLLLLRRT
jgi:hypothetical protein